MFTPLEEGLLLQSLSIKPTDVILEIGTGTGYLTACLSRLCKQVFSVDYYADFTRLAQYNCSAHNCNNITYITNNGYHGWIDKAPYDVIVITAAMNELSETIALQLNQGGRLFYIQGSEPIMRAQTLTLDLQNQWHTTLLFETCTAAMIMPFKTHNFVF